LTPARPETRYAKSGDVHLAYQAFGEGEVDLVMVRGYVHHVEVQWESRHWARALETLASFARVIVFDRRGTGLSDPLSRAPTLEERMDDVRAVMDAAGSRRAALLGGSEGVPMSILFAATYPERVEGLVLWGGMARSTPAEGYPFGTPAEALVQSGVEFLIPYWGQGTGIEISSPSRADDPEERAFYGRLERASVSPGMLGQLAQMFFDIDVREVVPSVHVPTLIMHREHDLLVNVRHSRWLAQHMPNARLVEVPGIDHSMEYQRFDEIAGEIEEFLTGARRAPEPDRVLATVLFTDIVDSTSTAAALGDARWRELLDDHERSVRGEVERAGGRLVKSTGDGFLATFDGPARGIRAARAILDGSTGQGIRVRAGLHTGECELRGDDIGGIAVHIAARVSALAGPGEVLVSRTVRDLVAGSGLGFDSRGSHELKGVPDAWELYEAVAP
jgi:class 3 adenylate cyclase